MFIRHRVVEMPLYMIIEKKRADIYFNRISNAMKIFNSIFNFLNIKDNECEVTLFEVDSFPSLNDHLEKMPMSLSSEKLRAIVEKSETPEDLGIEICSTLRFSNGSVPIVFTLVPFNRSAYHDITFEFIPNGIIKNFLDIERHISNFREALIENVEKYNKGIKRDEVKKTLKINKVFISVDTNTQHNIENYQLFYSRQQYELISELFFNLSEKARERLTIANRDKVASTLIDNFHAFNTITQIASNANIEMRGGSIIIIPKEDTSMKEFTEKTSKLIEDFVVEVYPDKKEYDKKLNDIFTKQL